MPNGPEDLRERLRERLSALKGELQRLRFETDRRWDELLTRLTDKPEEIVPEELLRDASLAARPAPDDGALPTETARRLDSAANQVEALTRFLEESRRWASRAALLVERRGRLEIWKSTGFPNGDARGRAVAALDGNAILERLRDGLPQRLAPGNEISAALGAGDASDAVLVPFVVREKVSGAVYADVAGGRSLDADAVALATWVAGLVVDRLARRKLVPSPALRAFEVSAAIEVSTVPDVPPSFASTPSPEQPAAPLPRDTSETERPRGGPLAPAPENERRDEARRFARLLASEIKLYNEDQVSEGRVRGDLYVRLRDHIERGRRLYEERVPEEIRSGSNYYYEELLDVLAGGNPETLR